MTDYPEDRTIILGPINLKDQCGNTVELNALKTTDILLAEILLELRAQRTEVRQLRPIDPRHNTPPPAIGINLAPFIAECITFSNAERIDENDIAEAYRGYAMKNGHPPGSRLEVLKQFKYEMTVGEYPVIRSVTGGAYLGAMITPPKPEEHQP